MNDPTINSSFTFDDDAAGSSSVDEIWAESPVIDLTAASLAGETRINITGSYLYDLYNALELFRLEYWDADASAWVPLQSLANNDNVQNYKTCNGLISFTSDPLLIASFTSTQLAGFKYRIYYNDAAGWDWGFCFGSPTIVSSTPPANDLGITSITLSPECGAGMKTVTVEITNYGSAPQTGFTVTYSMNSVAVTPELVSTTVPAFGTMSYSFTTMANLTGPSAFKAYPNLVTDADHTNDTLLTNIAVIANSLTYNGADYIDDSLLPEGTMTSICTDGLVSGDLGTCTQLSALVIDSLSHTYTGDLLIRLISPSNDTLNVSLHNNGSYADIMNVTFTDSAMTYITGNNPVPNSYFHTQDSIGLSLFDGTPSEGVWSLWIVDDAGGDFGYIYQWHLVFTDNSFVVNLGGDTSTCGAGSVMLDAGITGSHSYMWSTGETTQQITVDTTSMGGMGTYAVSVVVTDTLTGCSETDTVNVSFAPCAGVNDIENNAKLNIYPNPSNGLITVNFSSGKTEEITIKVINAQGQELYYKNNLATSGSLTHQIDLSNNAKGIYFLMVVTDSGTKTQRIILN